MAIKRNLHNIDMVVRIMIALPLIYIGFIDTSYIANSTVRYLLGAFGAINIVAVFLRSCPIYAIAGISTFRNKS